LKSGYFRVTIIPKLGEKMNRKLAIERARNCNRGCLVTGLRVMHGHKVSNSNIKNHRLFKANISKKNLISDILGVRRVRISRRGERTIEKYGGLDKFLLNYKKRKMPMQALTLRKELLAVTNNKNEVIQPESLG
jgi:large subunit ribosomal protein L28